MSADLKLDDVAVVYNRAAFGIHGVSLRVPAGSIVALLGANGAGKTTTLRAIGGFLPSDFAEVTGGRVMFGGADIGRLPPHRRVRLGIGLIPEREKVFRQLSIDENLRVSERSASPGELRDRYDFVFELFPALFTLRKKKAGLLSGGERQMLAIGKVLMLDPKVILADEVSLGIAPKLVHEMLDALRRINQSRGTSVLLVEQNAAAAFQIADYVYILETGRVMLSGAASELEKRDDVRSVYFGLGTESVDGPGNSALSRTGGLPWG